MLGPVAKKLAVFLFVLNTSCNTTDNGSDFKVVGGSLVPTGKFTSAVQINPRCGGVKIAKSVYLTAAHCVVSAGTFGGGISIPQAGTPFLIRTGNGTDKQTFDVAIAAVFVYPPYLEALNMQGASVINQPSAQNPSDIALIKIDQEIPQIGISPIRFDAIAVNTEVAYTGFGAESLSGGSSFESPFKYFTSSIDEVENNYLLIKGNVDEILQTGTAGKGDSGSPLFLSGLDGPTPPVIGINSFRGKTLIDGSTAIMIGISRLDEHATGNPKNWIEETLEAINEI